ncbi:MAG: FliI/YscN family ATPase [Alphaproteobacteria bacterium]|nr:FliI/YscN family ATPase [Alphaproteobacteria bacterium]MCB9928138.1 FliI/YscN family ATPase [Alphaproteobacteria bacterium]
MFTAARARLATYDRLTRALQALEPQPLAVFGQVAAARGPLLEVAGLHGFAPVGTLCRIETRAHPHNAVMGEVIGFRDGRHLVMLYGKADGVAPATRVTLCDGEPVRPDAGWLGRIVDGFGRPLDLRRHGPLPPGAEAVPLLADPPRATERRAVGPRLDTGTHVFNAFLPLCQGQRLGLFAGSGVGKSTLLATLAARAAVDVAVIGLIGERGREVREFVERTLGPEGLARSVVVVATSDDPPLLKRRALHLTTALAEYFRDRGRQVLLLVDSLTRFAEAHRDIAMAAGEPPSARGFPPSTFAQLAHLVERAGPGRDDPSSGDITALYTVLVQGSDQEEPLADAVRGLLDGHVVLDREIAERGRYPAIDVLRSVSRTLPFCASEAENALLLEARRRMTLHREMETMLRLGAYRPGTDPDTDAAIAAHEPLEKFLATGAERPVVAESFGFLKTILDQTALTAPRRPPALR